MRKTYDEGCLAAHALDLIGDRWALLVVRELMLGPRRFGAIKANLPGVATNILTRRLVELEAAGLVVRETLPPPAGVAVYALSQAGLALRGVMDALCRWGAVQPGQDPSKFISPTALMLSMRAMARPFSGQIGAHLVSAITLGFDLGDETFTATLDAQGFAPRRGAPEGSVVFRGSPNAVAPLIYGPLPVREMAAQTGAVVEGNPVVAQAAVSCFALAP